MNEYVKKEDVIRLINSQFPDAHYPSWYAELVKEMPAAEIVSFDKYNELKAGYKRLSEAVGMMIYNHEDLMRRAEEGLWTSTL